MKQYLLFISVILLMLCSTPTEPIEEVESFKIVFIATSKSTGAPCVGIWIRVDFPTGVEGIIKVSRYTNNLGRAIFVTTDKLMDGKIWRSSIKVERGDILKGSSGTVYFGRVDTVRITPCGW